VKDVTPAQDLEMLCTNQHDDSCFNCLGELADINRTSHKY
jgi:hypothetical protein